MPLLRTNERRCCGQYMREWRCRTMRNGNRGRMYCKCLRCGKLVADDFEGWRRGNPRCYCGRRSRQQIQRRGGQRGGKRVWTYRCLREKCCFKRRVWE
ncbi:hypothetical protein BJX61DRAFT_530159 [Aspergillus egyptiacus]|nr:hypothetical protein BJX61DRAFT_530159 [Aspergillus egyptiacus]